MAMLNILDMMKTDEKSVIGLTVSYDFGGTSPIVGIIADSKSKVFDWTNEDGGEYSTIRYYISFDGVGYYSVDKFVVGYQD